MKEVHGHVEDALCLNMQNNLRLPGAAGPERAEKPEKQHGENNAQKYGGPNTCLAINRCTWTCV